MTQNLLICVEESDSSVGFYDTQNLTEIARVTVGLWPHEIAVTKDGKTAYVTNFGIKDYDENIGIPGASISVIDVDKKAEINRLYTFRNKLDFYKFRGPHGVILSCDETKLYVNVESRDTLLEFDLTAASGQKCLHDSIYYGDKTNSIDSLPDSLTPLPSATHNMLLSRDGTTIWVVSGKGGVTEIDLSTKKKLRSFYGKGAIRGLSYSHDGSYLIASGSGEILFIDPSTLLVLKKFSVPGVRQFLYSKATSNGDFLICPAVWEGQIVRIRVSDGSIDRLIVGSDPIHVVLDEKTNVAYVSHGRSKHVTIIDLATFSSLRKIVTRGGPNGMSLAPFSPRPKRKTLKFGAVLPLSSLPDGRGSTAEGQDLRLGYQYWAECVNESGGLVVNEDVYEIEIILADSESKVGVDPNNRSDWLKPYTERNPPKRTLVEELTETLVNNGAQFFLGGYPSPPNLLSARIASEHNLPLVTSSGAAGIMYEQGLSNLFGIMSSANGFLNETFKFLSLIDTPPKTVVFWACEDPAALQDAETTAKYVTDNLEMDVLSNKQTKLNKSKNGVYLFNHLGVDFEKLIAETTRLKPDVLAITGHLPEGVAATLQIERKGLQPKAIVFSVGPALPQFTQQLGPSAEHLMGSAMWSSVQESVGHDRYISPKQFSSLFFKRFSKEASYLSAGAVACGLVYEEAIRRANSIDPEKIIETMSSSDFYFDSFYSRIEFDDNGLNSKRPLLTIQLRKENNEMKHVSLWPPELAGEGMFSWPFPGWPKNS